MKYLPVNKDLFIQNREKLAKLLKPGSAAVLNSNDIMPSSADSIRRFVQHTDIFYLTGIDQEESILLICPDAKEDKHKEILFIRETSEKTAVWEGQKYTKEQGSEISGIKTVYWTSSFNEVFRELAFESEHIYLNTNEHLRADIVVETRDARFLKWCKQAYPLHKYERLAPIMNHLRAVKSDIEVELIKTACNITNKAFRRLLKFIKPGVWEYEIEAEIWHEFMKNRSRGPAYDSIIASGSDSCILHYIKNDKQCMDQDLVLMDFGAEYANYTSDLTRTIPVNGRFTDRQKDVYNSVLRVHDQAADMLRPGNTIKEYQENVVKIMEKELIGLGLLDAGQVKNQDKQKPLYKKYFMHGTSHHLGLDVHDYGNKYRPFEPGMVLSCEPGIYIKDEGFGIRIENNILITEDKPVNLMADIPVQAGEIEDLMNG
ncbi:Aminopeptidase family protein [Desulfonema limicola]|uniref:Xaa-Pro aminopeptidase n=1 Tax=Desulfonema limicola TaxID=45656 RepID=A0A975BBM8_9BACT|nr:aminopeptidase P N-terminal domain-containing protein [Desulfonema limicola]QTA82397.1 Aminopeptidase family protein [Desulfonema limicola]